MGRLRPWQWAVLGLPIVVVVGFILVAAGAQIHTWQLNWIWAVFIGLLVGWRGLLVRWTQPGLSQLASAVAEVQDELAATTDAAIPASTTAQQAEAGLTAILTAAHADPPVWLDWNPFWQRCREVVIVVAQAYHPEVKYPLLNIYLPQAYGLIRGTVDDMDTWMAKLSPALSQVTVGQAVQAYEVYQQLEPSARKVWQVWNWAQWALNPVAAVARTLAQPANSQATQQLLANLSQMLREAALRTLYSRAVMLYSGTSAIASAPPPLALAKTQTLREILQQTEPTEIHQQPVNILLVGRTGAGKSSLINTLFEADQAEVDVLPSTAQLQSYCWQSSGGETLTLWDSPGYEQIGQAAFRQQVLGYARQADLLLVATPALDPALQMDVDFLREIQQDLPDLPVITVVTQVDRLRPWREWSPPYDWRWGNRPKEQSIREATEYRIAQLGDYCNRVLPVVAMGSDRAAWNADALSLLLVESIDPAKQGRLARFLRDQDARVAAAAQIIDHYAFQLATTQGLTALLKSPVLQLLATLMAGSPAWGQALAAQIPLEQVPAVVGKLQMTYELAQLLAPKSTSAQLLRFDWLALWPLLLSQVVAPDQAAWALGHTLVEYWTQGLSGSQLEPRFQHYAAQASGATPNPATSH